MSLGFGLLLAVWLAAPAQALVVTVDLGWGYNQDPGGNDLLAYNLQVGSVVQIIMFDSSVASAPGPSASDNFTPFGSSGGAQLGGHPYDPNDPPYPTDPTAYDPFSTPENHFIVYTATIQEAPYLDGYGNVWWQVYAQFEVVGTFDRLYVRVFGQDDLYQQAAWASYWGLSDVQQSTNIVGTWFVGPLENVVADQLNYFYVIPEPGTVALFVLGGATLAAGRVRRKKKPSK